jgi:hypothetical protein
MVRVPDPKWRKEREAFYRMLPELLKAHRDQFVAVHEERVVGEGAEPIELVKRAYAQFGYVPIYVGLVTDQPLPRVRVPSPRLVRRPAR